MIYSFIQVSSPGYGTPTFEVNMFETRLNLEERLSMANIAGTEAFYLSAQGPANTVARKLEETHRWRQVKEWLPKPELDLLVAKVEGFRLLRSAAFTNYFSVADVLAIILHFGLSKSPIPQKKLFAKNYGENWPIPEAEKSQTVSLQTLSNIGAGLANASLVREHVVDVQKAASLENAFRVLLREASSFPRKSRGAISVRKFKAERSARRSV
ncbi:MAG: hypothetical protein JWO40_248 [Candidatus Doudnabacteria bacterium]|nr:hypothetical protein [Candidatus Doudnabacteria bacterium]